MGTDDDLTAMPCEEVYGGDCKTMIMAPRWAHRIDKYRGPVPTHPTQEMALAAAQDPNTLPSVLVMLGNWDAAERGDVRDAARGNPSYPGT